MALFVDVIVDCKSQQNFGFITYKLAENFLVNLKTSLLGKKVLVSFGKKTYFAYVVNQYNEEKFVRYHGEDKLQKIKEIISIEGELPYLTFSQLRLIHKMQEIYKISPLHLLYLFLPKFMREEKNNYFYQLTAKALREIKTELAFKLQEKSYTIKKFKEDLQGFWPLLFAVMPEKMFSPLKKKLASMEIDKTCLDVDIDKHYFNEKEDIDLIIRSSFLKTKMKHQLFSSATLKILLEEGLLEKISYEKLVDDEKKEQISKGVEEVEGLEELEVLEGHGGKTLSSKQKEIFENLLSNFNSAKFEKALLQAVTGAGKTEIYLKLVENCIKQGQQALICVPEIALVNMMYERFLRIFKDKIAILHSGLKNEVREKNLRKIYNDEVDIIIGTRTSLFAPFSERLNLIIFDEEHDPSYISEDYPYYDARSIAELILYRKKSLLLLASATPSILTKYRCELEISEKQKKKLRPNWHFYRIDERIFGTKLPLVEIEDISQDEEKIKISAAYQAFRQNKENNSLGIFSNRLEEELRLCFAKNKKAMILFNRRGYSKRLECSYCSHIPQCEACEIPLVYHKKNKKLYCHRCQSKYELMPKCPLCQSPMIEKGLAIQALEEAFFLAFPDKKLLRLDFDSITNYEDSKKILAKFKNEDYHLLLGTQIIAKGHDFRDLHFISVLGLDYLLNMENYKMNERVFQLITQAAGRSGRQNERGKVLITSSYPRQAAIYHALSHDFDAFYQSEIKFRKEIFLPPFCYMIKLKLVPFHTKMLTMNLKKSDRKLRRNLDVFLSQKANYDDVVLTEIAPEDIAKHSGRYNLAFYLKIKDPSLADRVLRFFRQIQEKFRRNSKTKDSLWLNFMLEPLALFQDFKMQDFIEEK